MWAKGKKKHSWYLKQIEQDTHANSSRYSEQIYTQPQESGNHRQISVEKAPASPWCEEQRPSTGSGAMDWLAEQTPTQLAEHIELYWNNPFMFLSFVLQPNQILFYMQNTIWHPCYVSDDEQIEKILQHFLLQFMYWAQPTVAVPCGIWLSLSWLSAQSCLPRVTFVTHP